MKAEMVELKRFVSASDIMFVIPVYQRNYDWKKENCKQLFEDIKNIAKDSKGKHFIGTICHKMDGRYKSVIIDGQQRVTTIMLLFKAIYDTLTDETLKRKVKNQFLINEYANNELKIKLKPIKKDEKVYSKLINMEPFNEINFEKHEKNSNIYKNYMYFKELIVEAKKQGFEDYEIEDAIERLEIVELTLTDENPQVIFESLNSTGLDLTNTDLLRNYLLMSLDYKDQEELYLNYWLKIEDMIGSENMEDFMIYYLILQRRSDSLTINGKKAKINSNNLYYAFKKFLPDIERNNKDIIEECFKNMYKYAQYYKHFIHEENTIISNNIDKKLHDIFYLLENKDASIIIMYLYELYDTNKIDINTFDKLLDISISFIFRALVCKRTGLNKQFASLCVQKLDNFKDYTNYDKKYWSILTNGKGSYSVPKDNEFKQTLETKDLYNSLKSKKCKYMLYQLEKYSNPKECPLYSNGSIEHICPKTLSKKWTEYLNTKHDLMNYEKFVHTLGNLTLTGYNSELSNDTFENKKIEYKKSNYIHTRNVSENTDWTSEQIKQRANKLSTIALKIWNLPSEYNKEMAVDTGITYTLESDLESFTGTKPETISILETQKTIMNWSDFLIEIAQTFYNLDNLLFLELLSYDKFPGTKTILSTTPNDMTKYHEISNGLYINTNNSTVESLKLIKCIIDYFDTNTDANFINDIWFTLRRA